MTAETVKEKASTEVTEVCFLDFSNEALQRIIEDSEISSALNEIPNPEIEEISVFDNVAMLADLENPSLIGSLYYDRSDAEIRAEWSYKIPQELLESIKKLIKDLPREGQFIFYDSMHSD